MPRVQGYAGRRRVVPADGRPRGGSVAAFAVGPQRRAVAVVLPPHPVTVVAAGWCPLRHPVEVTRRARDRLMPALEREHAALVEGAGGVPEGGAGCVARRAVEAERAAVPVPVARAALGRHVDVRAGLVAGSACFDQPGVTARQRETGFTGVVERRRVERPEVRIGALVLHVARPAVARHLPVHALLRRHALRDGLMTLQAAGGLGGAGGRVALHAAGPGPGGDDLRVGVREGAGHLRRRLGGSACRRENAQRAGDEREGAQAPRQDGSSSHRGHSRLRKRCGRRTGPRPRQTRVERGVIQERPLTAGQEECHGPLSKIRQREWGNRRTVLLRVVRC